MVGNNENENLKAKLANKDLEIKVLSQENNTLNEKLAKFKEIWLM